MAVYVDGFVLPVPKANAAAYARMARKCARIRMGHGALAVVECRADDVKAGKLTSFPQAAEAVRSPHPTTAFMFSDLVLPTLRRHSPPWIHRRKAASRSAGRNPRRRSMLGLRGT